MYIEERIEQIEQKLDQILAHLTSSAPAPKEEPKPKRGRGRGKTATLPDGEFRTAIKKIIGTSGKDAVQAALQEMGFGRLADVPPELRATLLEKAKSNG
jgi:hypothetical protein